jgi:hypothetical protein
MLPTNWGGKSMSPPRTYVLHERKSTHVPVLDGTPARRVSVEIVESRSESRVTPRPSAVGSCRSRTDRRSFYPSVSIVVVDPLRFGLVRANKRSGLVPVQEDTNRKSKYRSGNSFNAGSGALSKPSRYKAAEF